MIGVVVPVHNEEADLTECISAINIAIGKIKSLNIAVEVLFVMDSCNDHSMEIVQGMKADFMVCNYQCVGKTRALGIEALIEKGVNWIACTDADSCVHEDWLLEQIQHQPTDVICGIVEINKWDHLSTASKQKYLNHYQDRMGHPHIHGANLSFSREAYLTVGGFEPLPSHEDVNLVEKFKMHHYSIIWTNKVRVTTSSRLLARAPHGFSSFLRSLNVD